MTCYSHGRCCQRFFEGASYHGRRMEGVKIHVPGSTEFVGNLACLDCTFCQKISVNPYCLTLSPCNLSSVCQAQWNPGEILTGAINHSREVLLFLRAFSGAGAIAPVSWPSLQASVWISGQRSKNVSSSYFVCQNTKCWRLIFCPLHIKELK
jgi:hypothetical protein